jgi:hypothetical protein
MKTSLIFGGLLVIFIGIIPLERKIDEYSTQKTGDLVKATVIDVPNCFGAKIRHSIKIKYNDTIYYKRVGAPCDSYKIGQAIQLRHTPGTDIFLYMDEEVRSEFVAIGLLVLLGSVIIAVGFRKKSST